MAFERQLSGERNIQRVNPAQPHVVRSDDPVYRLSFGNQAAQRLLSSRSFQTKMTVSQPGDRYEQEADHVADEVMRMPEAGLNGGRGEADARDLHIQRMCGECEEELHRQTTQEDEELQQSDLGKQKVQRTRCDPPEPNPCPTRPFNMVMDAFQLASNWLPGARDKITDYIAAPSDQANQSAARALRRHFHWTEAIRQDLIFPDIPRMVLQTINSSFTNIRDPIGADCAPVVTSSPDRDGGVLHARAPSTWNGNCYIFYPPFFAGRGASGNRRRARTALHEMMHRWHGMSDVAYEWERSYPPEARAAQSNADSYASLIRDLG